MGADHTTIRNCIFQFKCSARWEDMIPVTPTVRFCGECQKEVFYCSSDEDLAYNVRLNRCIAIKPCIEAEVMLGMVDN